MSQNKTEDFGDSRLCPECKCSFPESYFVWTKDRYGIPYRKVCEDCRSKVENEIADWQWDYLDAGESLDEE